MELNLGKMGQTFKYLGTLNLGKILKMGQKFKYLATFLFPLHI